MTRLRRTGDRAAAERVVDSLGALRRPYVFGAHTMQRAAIVAHLGDAERATQRVRQAFAEGQYRHVVHYAPLLAPLRRYPPFVAVIAPER